MIEIDQGQGYWILGEGEGYIIYKKRYRGRYIIVREEILRQIGGRRVSQVSKRDH